MRWMRRPWASDGLDMEAVHRAPATPRLKRSLFLAVLGAAAFLEGFYLGPLGFDWFALAMVMTIVLAIGWMRTYWAVSPKKQEQ
jgi:hypothetical protein